MKTRQVTMNTTTLSFLLYVKLQLLWTLKINYEYIQIKQKTKTKVIVGQHYNFLRWANNQTLNCSITWDDSVIYQKSIKALGKI